MTPVTRAIIDFQDANGSRAGPERLQFSAPQQVLVARTLADVRPVLEQVDALSRQGLWCVGFVRYEAASAFDPALQTHAAEGPLVWFGVHTKAFTSHELLQQGRPFQPAPEAESPVWQLQLGRSDFDSAMDRIHAAIAAGDFYQVNFTTRLHARFSGDALHYYEALRHAQPQGFGAFIDTGDEQVLSVSPELFFDWDGHRVLSRPMKGTAPRGATAAEDEALAERLRGSPKEQAENVMIVDLIRNDLSRVAQPFSVTVPRLFGLEALPTVWQMTSDVTARTRNGTTLWDLFAALFPCGSVTGAPKVQAMREIVALEPDARGVYCGAVGVVRPGGHATFNVPIRTVTLRGTHAVCGIGSGITSDAQKDGEWAEWAHKRLFLERASQPFQVLETLALREGRFSHLELHIQRMSQAAAHFGFAWGEALVRAALDGLVARHPRGSWRVRLLLSKQGEVDVEAYSLADTPMPVRLQLARSPLQEAAGEFVRFKTTRRAHYDAHAPSQTALTQGVFDTLLYNPQGELTECTRGNIAFLIDGRWVTPSVSCGLLPGVGRALLLAQGKLQEEVVRLEALPRVQACAFINSLRGWMDAQLLPNK
jgi:para-aminobenzoate synthetase/4-amino-4-deoxychorismate lyase